MDTQWTERRACERHVTAAHVMMKVGMDGSSYGFGTIVQISTAGLLLEADIVARMGVGIVHQHVGGYILFIGSESWNRQFTIMARLLRVSHDFRLACSICSVSSDKFLKQWILKAQQ